MSIFSRYSFSQFIKMINLVFLVTILFAPIANCKLVDLGFDLSKDTLYYPHPKQKPFQLITLGEGESEEFAGW